MSGSNAGSSAATTGSGAGITGGTGSAGGSGTSAAGSAGATGATGSATSTTGATGTTGASATGATGTAGTTGATGAMGATDAGGMPDAGTSGSSGVTGSFPLQCAPDAGAAPAVNPTIEMIVQGTNGTLASLCDAQGNLSEPVCEIMQSCGPGPNPGCTQTVTGNVVTQTVDCAGHCVNGACDGRCPVAGDPFHCVASDADGGVSIVDDANERNFACTIVFSAPNYDCVQGILANVQGTIHNLTVSNAVMSGGAVYCTGQSFGNLDVSITGVTLPAPYQDEDCTLACSVAP